VSVHRTERADRPITGRETNPGSGRSERNERDRYDLDNKVEALLTALFVGWQTWRFMKPDGIEMFGAFDSVRGAAVLHGRGFVTVILHDHLATERMITCQCPVREHR
jgi:hypothetical protein